MPLKSRRSFLQLATSTGFVALGGCSAQEEFEPDFEPVQRLGAAPQLSMVITPEEEFNDGRAGSFEEWATRLATEHASRRLRERLAAADLTGTGVSIGQGVVRLDELDQPSDAEPPTESEFRRAGEIGPRVFHFHQYSRDGDLISTPTVPFQSIVDETPRSFEVTVNSQGNQYVAILPALCQRGWIREN